MESSLPSEKLTEAQTWPLYVFRCPVTGHPMKVGFTPDEFDLCQCGFPLEPVEVVSEPSLEEARREARQWKANHDSVVGKKRVAEQFRDAYRDALKKIADCDEHVDFAGTDLLRGIARDALAPPPSDNL